MELWRPFRLLCISWHANGQNANATRDLGMSWTDERIEKLKKLWGSGKTAAEIAEELGDVTRNAGVAPTARACYNEIQSCLLPFPRKSQKC